MESRRELTPLVVAILLVAFSCVVIAVGVRVAWKQFGPVEYIQP